jgi:hypothetical protein
MRPLAVALTGLLLTSCFPIPAPDSRPPVLLDARVADDGGAVDLAFDEPVSTVEATGDVAADAAPTIAGSKVALPLPKTLEPGHPYHWSAEVADPARNVTSLAGRFYGPNDHPAQLRLNEVRIVGSADHPDFVELRAEAGGSLGGWTVEVRSSTSAVQKIVLPDRPVDPGDLVVVWAKAPGQDLGPLDQVWEASKGLPGTRGAVVLREAPGKAPVDGLVWAAKTGEGRALAQASGWPTGAELTPAGCTATRTWSRTDDPSVPWILTATGGATPGHPNKLTPWGGPTSSRKAPPKTKADSSDPAGAP